MPIVPQDRRPDLEYPGDTFKYRCDECDPPRTSTKTYASQSQAASAFNDHKKARHPILKGE